MTDINCPIEECEGKIELSTKVYFDIGGELQTLGDEQVIVIDNIETAEVNDLLASEDGLTKQPFNLESELFVGCDHCGTEFHRISFSDDILERQSWQSDRARRRNEDEC